MVNANVCMHSSLLMVGRPIDGVLATVTWD